MFPPRFPPSSGRDPSVLRVPPQPNPSDLPDVLPLPSPLPPPPHLSLPPPTRPYFLWDELPLTFLPRETLPVLAPLLPQDTRSVHYKSVRGGILDSFEGYFATFKGEIYASGIWWFYDFFNMYKPSISWRTPEQCLFEYSLKYRANYNLVPAGAYKRLDNEMLSSYYDRDRSKSKSPKPMFYKSPSPQRSRWGGYY